MKISIISFSRAGYMLGEKLHKALLEDGHETSCFTKSMYTKKIMDESQLDDNDRAYRNVNNFAEPVDMSIKEWTGQHFSESNAIIFIGACGIAVRSIAPFLKSVNADPAVVVVDEQGKFVISLLSGHVAGANELADRISELTGAVSVVTSSQDTNEKFAVDAFARKNQCFTSDLELAKEISAMLFRGETVGFTSDFPWIGEIPAGLEYLEDEENKPEVGIYVTNSYAKHPFLHTLYLIPRVITVGVACDKGTPGKIVEKVIRKACDEQLIPSVSMERVASLDSMKDEEGIIQYCKERNLPFVTYSQEELKTVDGTFAESRESCEVAGEDSMCEHTAIMAGSMDGVKSSLILRHYFEDGVCVSLAKKKWSVNF